MASAYPIYFYLTSVDSKTQKSSQKTVEVYYVRSFSAEAKQAFIFNIPIPDEAQSLIQGLGGVIKKYTFTYSTSFSSETEFLAFIDNIESLINLSGTATTARISIPYLHKENLSCILEEITYNINEGEVHIVHGQGTLYVGQNLIGDGKLCPTK